MPKMNRVGYIVAVIVALSLFTTRARADEPRTHDGFQFRGVVGPGYLADSESASDGSFTGGISGPAGSLELYFGGSPIPGLTIGGMLGGTSVAGPSVSLNGQSYSAPNSVSFGLYTIGPYVDWYPDAHGGFHALALVGLATVTVSDGQNSSANTGAGFALGAGVGYDWWLSDKWSIGVLARLTYAITSVSTSTSSTDPDTGDTSTNTVSVSDSVIVPALLFSVAYQ